MSLWALARVYLLARPTMIGGQCRCGTLRQLISRYGKVNSDYVEEVVKVESNVTHGQRRILTAEFQLLWLKFASSLVLRTANLGVERLRYMVTEHVPLNSVRLMVKL